MVTGFSPLLGVNVVTVELSVTVGSSSRGPLLACAPAEEEIGYKFHSRSKKLKRT